jgi:integrase
MPEYSLTQHRGKWAVTFTDAAGRRRRITTGAVERGRAEHIARDIWQHLTAAQSERIADLWPVYVRDRIQDGARGDRFRAHWTALEPAFGQRIGSAVTREDCRAYYRQRKALGYADSTIKTDLELLRACLRRHYGNSAPDLWIPPASKPRTNWLTKEQARQILDMTETPHIRLFLILALTTGARAGAILDLTWDRVHFDTGTIDFKPAGRVLTNKRRTEVPMNAMARAALQEAAEARLSANVIEYVGKPVKSVKKAIERLSARSGVPFSPHVLRHSAAVWMAQDNVPMQMISQYLGHTSLRMTEGTYARYSPAFMQDASAATMF